MKYLRVVPLILMASALAFAASPARADPATDKARGHYETGLELFYAREHAQALIEFQRAHEVKPRPATLFMMGQCEYLLGSLRQARDHYEAYLRESPTGEFVEVAKDRIEAINRRPATLVINTVPDQVDVRIVTATPPTGVAISGGKPPDKAPPIITGQAPNTFAVPRGRWVVALSKPNYQTQQITVEVEVAETKMLSFTLEPIPARLEIETVPAGATLYVNGNRALNPYRQDVAPGRFQLFAEATDYEDRTEDFVLGPGDRHLMTGPRAFHLRYVQRSGRPELVFASAVMGGLVAAGAVAGTVVAAQEMIMPADVSFVSLTLGGAVAGIVAGALIANSVAPSYIPDNRALFIIGGMWVGAAEGVLTGMTIRQGQQDSALVTSPADVLALGAFRRPAPLSSKLRAGFLGSLPGLAVGVTAGALLMNRAPTYGRVALIQSAAVGGAVVGSLVAVALRWNPFGWQQVVKTRDDNGNVTGVHLEGAAQYSILDLSLPALIGLNVGLVGGLLGAYLPDQSRYGPSWKRIALIDLAAGAGALAAGTAACVADYQGCLTAQPDPSSRARTAAVALLGGGVGLIAGILTTRNIDTDVRPTTTSSAAPPVTLVPLPNPGGGQIPMLAAVGLF